jgi:hypothetical protein
MSRAKKIKIRAPTLFLYLNIYNYGNYYMQESTYIIPIILVKKILQTQSQLKIICKRWPKKEGFHAFVAPITLCLPIYIYYKHIQVHSNTLK